VYKRPFQYLGIIKAKNGQKGFSYKGKWGTLLAMCFAAKVYIKFPFNYIQKMLKSHWLLTGRPLDLWTIAIAFLHLLLGRGGDRLVKASDPRYTSSEAVEV